MYLPSFISKPFFLGGGARISRNLEREDTRQSPQQAADKVPVRALSTHCEPNAVVREIYALYEADIQVAGIMSAAYIVDIAVLNAADQTEYEKHPEA